MCVVCPEHESASGGVDLAGIVVAVAVAAAAALFYQVMTVIWPLYLAVLIVAWVWVLIPRKTRKRLRRKVWRRVRRAVRERRARKAVVAQEFAATLSITHGGRTEVLDSGPVPGRWDSAAAVQAEIMRRFTARYALPPGAVLACTVAPVTLAVKGGDRS